MKPSNKYKLLYFFFLFYLLLLAQSSFSADDSLRFDAKIVNKQLAGISKQRSAQKAISPRNGTYLLIFLDIECPICQKYTLKIRTLDSICKKNEINLVGIFTDRGAKKELIFQFKQKYNLQIATLIDKKLKLAKALRASTTPEVFLINSRIGSIAYRGLIDDWFYMLGKSRKEPTVHYLLDAIDSFQKKQEISIKKTTPIGCLIQY